jgi:hypothetical protein
LVELRGRRRGTHARHHPLCDASTLARFDLGLQRGSDLLFSLLHGHAVREAHPLHLELYASIDDELAIGLGGSAAAA